MAKKLIGEPHDRIEGALKVTGKARYSADMNQPNMAHAVLVMSTVGSGRIREIDTKDADKVAGVLNIMTHRNAPKLAGIDKNKPGETALSRVLHLMQDDEIYYNNQPVAVVIADSLDGALEAARLVQVRYHDKKNTEELPANQNKAQKPDKLQRADDPVDTERGDMKAGLASAAGRIEQTYHTPTETHNALEPHATVAVWEGSKLTLYNATQGIFPTRERVAELWGMPKEDVRIVMQFLGGGFGSKGAVWSQVLLAPMAAKQVNRPVKLVLRREDMFGMVGSRSATVQKMTVGASKDGKLTAMAHNTIMQTSVFDEFTEPCGLTTRMLYTCPNQEVTHRMLRASVGTPAPMRAPGEASGLFALESAMDEMAYAINMDPVEFRLKNYTETDPQKGHPFSSKSLRECYRLGAERFGWAKRNPQPRSMRDGNYLIGMGMATAVYPTNREKSSATVRLKTDGSVQVETGTQDIGTGTYTVMVQIAAETLGLSPDQVLLSAGDTKYPETTVSGGSRTTASTGSAVMQAAQLVLKQAKEMAINDPKSPLKGAGEADILVQNGRLYLQSNPKKGETYAALLKRSSSKTIQATTESKPGDEKEKYSMYAFGAQFVEVRVDEDLGEVRLAKMTGAFAGGRIINAKTARSQLIGGMIWGVSMALHEDTLRDGRNARIMNPNLAEYHVPVNADIKNVDGFFVEEVDEIVNPLGVKGIGEIGITGAAAAVANAVFHATGKRMRDLPITVDKVLAFNNGK